jgi:predicted ATPase
VRRTYEGQQILFDMVGAPEIPAHSASEGTLLLLGMLTILRSPSRPRLLLIDDLERGLHPGALGPFVAQIRRILELDPDLQIVATTHSPYLLDYMKFEEVRLTTTQKDGSVLCAGLNEHPEFEKWKESMLPGEFWSMVAEDWIRERSRSPHAP